MRQVISAAPSIDVSGFAAKVAGQGGVIADPSRRACERFGYQTLYEVPATLQKRIRRDLIRAHAESLRDNRDAICDHSVFVWLADWMRWLWPETPTREWEEVLSEARPAVERSEVIYHVIAGPAASYDGYRWLDAGHAGQVERLARGLYREFGCESRVREVRL
jgi:hypothetical protein